MVRQVKGLSMGGKHLKKPAFLQSCSWQLFLFMNNYRNVSLTKEQIIAYLIDAANAYAQYKDKILAFVYQKNVKSNYEILKVRFGQENFMHLVGIRSKTLSAAEFYQACFSENISFDDCTPSHDPSNRNTRILLLPKMMMFSECKIYNIAEKDVSTLQNDFQIASGNQSGIIGFDYREGVMSADVAVPTTLLNRPLTDYCSEPKRILFVFEMTSSEKYVPIYEIKAGLYSRLIEDGKLTNILID